MLRRTRLVCLALTTALTWMIADSQDCEAQRILRRIQSRLPQRVLPIRILPLESPRPSTPAGEAGTELSPTRAGSPEQLSPAGRRTEPQRVSPIETQGGSTNDLGRAPPDADRYGRSILAPMKPGEQPQLDNPAVAENTSGQNATPSLGIQVLPSQRGMSGLEVADFRPHSLADEAGLRKGDVIVAVDGRPTPTVADIARQLRGRRSGEEIEATIVRQDQTTKLALPLVDRPSMNVAVAPRQSKVVQASAEEPIPIETPPALPEADFTPTPADTPSSLQAVEFDGTPVEPINTDPGERVASDRVKPAIALEPVEGNGESPEVVSLGIKVTNSENMRGAIVTEIAENSPALAAGLQGGDRIVSLDGRLVLDRVQFEKELAARKAGDQFTLQLIRDGALVAVDVALVRPAASKGAAPNKKSEGGGMLDGFGSVFGGLLGSNEAADPPRKDARKEPGDDDEMAFGDDEPIGQVVFEGEVVQAIDELKSDPPSLEKLEPPAGDTDVDTIDRKSETDSVEALRKEIERLQERLKALEEKS